MIPAIHTPLHTSIAIGRTWWSVRAMRWHVGIEPASACNFPVPEADDLPGGNYLSLHYLLWQFTMTFAGLKAWWDRRAPHHIRPITHHDVARVKAARDDLVAHRPEGPRVPARTMGTLLQSPCLLGDIGAFQHIVVAQFDVPVETYDLTIGRLDWLTGWMRHALRRYGRSARMEVNA